jgi:hypothetical protein
VEEIPGWMKTFELAMMVLTALCIAGVLLVVVLHLGFRGECQTLRVC